MEKGKISITIQREDRLCAITELSKAIRIVAEALNQAPSVLIERCTVTKADVGISIDTEDKVNRTEIVEET